MNDPLVLLLLGTAAVAFTVYFFWPKKGMLAKKQKALRNKERVLIEDALKHLYDCEYKNLTCTLNSIAGNLSISSDKASSLAGKLEAMELLKTNAEKLELSGEGRSYALRVIRIHRLWERYLADETGTEETDWHSEAELKEHQISLTQADKLAAQLGNPIFDPHGDPIPTSSGEIPERIGFPLSNLKAGEKARIIHIEDEPAAVYAQIAAEGLYPGLHVRMIKPANDKILFEAKGEEIVLAPILAANITVAEIPAYEKIIEKYKTLDSLKPGEEAEVIGISKACRGQQRRRLMDFGVVPGSIISSEFSSAGGDPIAFKIRGATIALRKEHTKLIFVKENKDVKDYVTEEVL